MTPDQRMSEAIDELEALVNSGTPVVAAITKCAAEFNFSAEIMELRARKIFGELTTLRQRNRDRAELETREHRAETAVDAYLIEDPDQNFPEWFERRVGRAPTKVESDEFQARYLKHLIKDIKFEI